MTLISIVSHCLNQQFTRELEAYYQYLALSAFFDLKEFTGFSHWCKTQAEEERQHAMKIYEYLLQRDEAPNFDPVASPAKQWNSPLEAFRFALSCEQNISVLINDSLTKAQQCGDHATYSFLQWFAMEQVEEEDKLETIVERVRLAGDRELLLIDQELGKK